MAADDTPELPCVVSGCAVPACVVPAGADAVACAAAGRSAPPSAGVGCAPAVSAGATEAGTGSSTGAVPMACDAVVEAGSPAPDTAFRIASIAFDGAPLDTRKSGMVRGRSSSRTRPSPSFQTTGRCTLRPPLDRRAHSAVQMVTNVASSWSSTTLSPSPDGATSAAPASPCSNAVEKNVRCAGMLAPEYSSTS